MQRRDFLALAAGTSAAGLFAGIPTSSLARADSGWTPSITGFDKVMGSEAAPITMIEYASFTCSHCARFHSATLPELKERYIDSGKVRLVFRDFPLDRLALKAGMLARCVPDHRYFLLVDILFQWQSKWRDAADPSSALSRIGRFAGLAQAEIDHCLNDRTLAEKILSLRLEASNTYGVDSTPTFVVEGEKLSGALPTDVLAGLFDQLLADDQRKS